ncbi:MAG: hypothetical protein K2Q26_08815 [Bdellovibrionales bacterium]|nr:hypothetical protein [Bdellovibrionales bacterium]
MKHYLLPLGMISAGSLLLIQWNSPAPQSRHTPLPSVPQAQFRSAQLSKDPGTATNSQRSAQVAVPSARVTQPLQLQMQRAFAEPYAFFQQKLETLRNCLKVRNCKYPQSDPQSYEIAVYEDITKTLRTLRSWVLRHNYKDDRIAPFLKEFLPFESAGVKMEALRILSTQTADPTLVEPILNHVILFYHPESISLAMQELHRIDQPSQRDRMDEVFASVLVEGSVNAAVEIAKSLKPFVDESNRQNYRRLLHRLDRTPLSEEIAEELRSALD